MIINFKNVKIKTSPSVYSPSEDTFFLEDTIRDLLKSELKANNIKNIAEMGCGSGYITILLMKLFPESFLYSIDINKLALELTAENILLNRLDDKKITFINSDLFSNVKHYLFDLIIFNPPYLPQESSTSDLETIMWEGGDEIISNFLVNSEKFLTKMGCIILLLSNYQVKNDSPETYINKITSTFRVKKFFKKKFYLETLYGVFLTKSVSNNE